MNELLDKFREHIREEDMDDSMLSFYLDQGKKYVKRATGNQSEYLVILTAGVFYEYRAAEKDLEDALNALTPFFVQEVFFDGEETDQ